MTPTRARIAVGFAAGAVLAAEVDAAAADRLRAALLAGERWHELATDTGPVLLATAGVAYVQVDRAGPRAGFD